MTRVFSKVITLVYRPNRTEGRSFCAETRGGRVVRTLSLRMYVICTSRLRYRLKWRNDRKTVDHKVHERSRPEEPRGWKWFTWVLHSKSQKRTVRFHFEWLCLYGTYPKEPYKSFVTRTSPHHTRDPHLNVRGYLWTLLNLIRVSGFVRLDRTFVVLTIWARRTPRF